MGTLSRLVNAVKSPFLSVARAYNSTAQKRPLSTGLITTLLKTSAADCFAQKVRGAARAGNVQQRRVLTQSSSLAGGRGPR
jgi:hypothetical protein